MVLPRLCALWFWWVGSFLVVFWWFWWCFGGLGWFLVVLVVLVGWVVLMLPPFTPLQLQLHLRVGGAAGGFPLHRLSVRIRGQTLPTVGRLLLTNQSPTSRN